MSHTANTAHAEPTTRRDARNGAVEDVIVTEDGRVLNDPTHLEVPGHGNTPGAWAMAALAILGFAVGCVGMLADWFPVVWVGVGLMVLGGIVGLVTARTVATGGHDEPGKRSGH